MRLTILTSTELDPLARNLFLIPYQPSSKPAGHPTAPKQMHFGKELISTETPARSLMSSAEQNKSREKKTNRIFPKNFIQEENSLSQVPRETMIVFKTKFD